jgi:hypothetical protein
MGSTFWSDDHYRDREAFRRANGKDAFEFHAANARLPVSKRRVHQAMNPHGVKVRESRDSEAHPDSRAVAVLFDVTGSMGSVPRILQQNLCQLMSLLERKNYLAQPQILIGGIGDATCDQAPLQIGQFEAGIEIDDNLANLWLEGGGGGQQTESYELAMYFLARKTALDCYEKRQQRGYLFLIGDEMPYSYLKRREVQAIIGDELQADIPIKQLIKELQVKYDTYFILPNLTSYYDDPKIHGRWVELLGQNVIRLEDPAGISELIASTIGLAENVVDLDGVQRDLKEAGRGEVRDAVARALKPLAKAGPRGHTAAPRAFGAGTGLRRL